MGPVITVGHLTNGLCVMRQHNGDLYIVVLLEPQCERLSQAVTGRVGVG